MLNEASPRLPNFTFNGGHNVKYFKNQASGNLGAAYLVGQSQFRLDNFAADSVLIDGSNNGFRRVLAASN